MWLKGPCEMRLFIQVKPGEKTEAIWRKVIEAADCGIRALEFAKFKSKRLDPAPRVGVTKDGTAGWEVRPRART